MTPSYDSCLLSLGFLRTNADVRHRRWLTALLGRRPTKVAAIALANKIARMAWAMMAKGEPLQATRRTGGVNEFAPGIGVM